MKLEESFLFSWSKFTNMASDLDVSNPILPRQQKRPQRYEVSTQEEHFQGCVEDFYQPLYFQALHLAINGFQKRFNQPEYQVCFKLEYFLLKLLTKRI